MADTTVQGAVEDWIREKWMPTNLGQPYTKGCGRLSSGGEFEYDGISADGSTVACISTSKHKTSGGRNGMGKWFKLRSDMLYLVMAEDVGRRLLILTEPCMFKHYEAERGRGRVPREVEVVLAELPADLRERLAASRERASEEVQPSSKLAARLGAPRVKRMDFESANGIIEAEYSALCNRLGVSRVTLDVYEVVPGAPAGALTAAETSLGHGTPGYDGKVKKVVMPLNNPADWPTEGYPIPPESWTMWEGIWPSWRIDLWHEFVHQVSDQVFHAWDPKEPATRPPGAPRGSVGHGAGWWKAVTHVAAAFQIPAKTLNALLDR